MTVRHPEDLQAWRRWQERQHPWRAVRGALRDRLPGREPVSGMLTTAGPRPRILVAVDSFSPSNVAAVLAPIARLAPGDVALLAPGPWPLPGAVSSTPWTAGDPLPEVGAVLTAGHHLPLGAVTDEAARRRGLPHLVAQHGLLTPVAPPLPAAARLLAWSPQDADFWAAGRGDVTSQVVGSQLLWDAAVAAGGDADLPREVDGPPTYLGQLHGAELPFRVLADAAEAFCRRTGATYRPHPSERDRRSRRRHAAWEASGIAVDRSARPLARLGTPVVSVFSTGVLEAAALGLPAYVDLPDPPAWLRELWRRYGMVEHGSGRSTPAPPLPATAPAAAVAALVEELT